MTYFINWNGIRYKMSCILSAVLPFSSLWCNPSSPSLFLLMGRVLLAPHKACNQGSQFGTLDSGLGKQLQGFISSHSKP